jgi:hypothetical protein
VANLVYDRGFFVFGRDFVSGSTASAVRVMLVSTGYTPALTHNTVDDGTTSDPLSYEIGVANYARHSLASLAAFEDDTNFIAGIDAADAVFTALGAGVTIGGAVSYRYSTSGGTTSDTGQDLISFYDLTDTPTNGGDITVQWASTSAGGWLRLTSTS